MRFVPSRTSLAALATSVTTVVASTALVIVGTAPPVAEVRADRIRATPTPKPTPSPPPPTAECPQMDNPGGKLQWRPSQQPGPMPTNGTVALPKLGVEAPIVRVGIDANNAMVVPKNARDVAWLDRGGIPGYTQNVVLAGHINYSRVAGSFSRLGELKPGDEIVLKIEAEEIRYRVVWNCLFDFDTDRADQVMGYTTKPSATLISCGGVFDPSAGTHNKRIAVRAEQVTPA